MVMEGTKTTDQILRGIGWGAGSNNALYGLGPSGVQAQVTGEEQSVILRQKCCNHLPAVSAPSLHLFELCLRPWGEKNHHLPRISFLTLENLSVKNHLQLFL